jgi:hypothetical protein
VVADPATIFGAVSGFTFDQSQISASGMLVNDANTNRPLSIGTFNTSLCSSLEQTLVFEVDLTEYPGTSGDGVVVIGFGDNSTTDPLQVDWYPDSGTPTNANWEATNADWGSFDVVANGPGLAVWKMAITTKANGDVVSSFNGNPIHTDVASEPNAGTPNVFIFGSNDTLDGSKPLCGYFRRIVRFAPQPDADLPTLSTP